MKTKGYSHSPLSTAEHQAPLKLCRGRATSVRSYQRTTALWIARLQEKKKGRRKRSEPDVPKEVLRAACREMKFYDAACFNYYMADGRRLRSRGGALTVQLFSEVRDADGQCVGWDLTARGREVADALA
jgi:hypothetical protein